MIFTASTVDTERLFKKGRQTITYSRHKLADPTIRASICFGQWSAVPGLVPPAPLMRIIEERLSRRADRWTPENMIHAIRTGRIEQFLEETDAGDEGGDIQLLGDNSESGDSD